MKRMSEPIEYSLVLKAIDGKTPTGANAPAWALSAWNVLYNDLIFDSTQISGLFQRIAQVHSCTCAKIEFAGACLDAEAFNTHSQQAIDFCVSGSGFITTQANSSSTTYGQVIGTICTMTGSTFNCSYDTIRKIPLYVSNIQSITSLRIQLVESFSNTKVGTSTDPALDDAPYWSIMLKITPILNS